MKLLVSVRSVAEAEQAAAAGIDFIDLKDPARGALGGLDVDTIAAIVGALRRTHPHAVTSATIGDLPLAAVGAIVERVRAVAATGVRYVKVGFAPDGTPAADVAHARALLDALGRTGAAVVPVLIADHGLDARLADAVLGARPPAVMADTDAKHSGSLLERVEAAALARFVAAARAAGVPVGLAGALRTADAPRLAALAPDFAGFRSAVTAGERAGPLDAQRLIELTAAFRPFGATAPVAA